MKINKDLAISENGFLFNPATGESFTANPMAFEIISMLKEGQRSEKIIEWATQHYLVEKSTVEKDLHDFFGLLRLHQLSVEND
ncbi:MAG: PqqD family protein [Lentimicrobium sp.]|jgi:acyl-homoserine lactone acylase PvdQ|nr:PqqD family protein [Lentimicrobium sp.]